MNKPEKQKENPYVFMSKFSRYKMEGANEMWDKWEAYHNQEMDKIKQAMSEEKISRVIEMFTMQEMYGTELAKAIHKLIGK